ncbi:response regulator [Agrobacterium vitis]|uniref:histidine kinase n=3 Tax=Agrobacterium vitis TaxID=373 RepID=A0AAE5AZ40_AGRVI|nr:response regulator [Allorhizobium sp. Av2]MCM2443331.1 response regulator [Agrobacterium vitis]MUZ60955.1 response regulator [Agrobacterium vitis]MVA69255.1 response regulator [Agrobacterium vitis]MVA90266.1 response regulator [Agrobacterium vitis]
MTMSPKASNNFLPLGNPCADAIARFEWSDTPLGDLGQWSSLLRNMTSYVLGSGVPMVLLWGAQGTVIYNDAYASFAGSRHPGSLGQTLRRAWPELLELDQNFLTTVLSGKTLSYRDQHLVVERNSAPHDVWLNIDASCVRNDDGVPCGAVIILKDTTARVRVEQRLQMAQKAGGIGTFEWYPDTGLLEVSDEYRRIWGLSPDIEVTDTLLVSLLHPDDRSNTGPAKLGSDNPLDYVEYRRLFETSGEVRWIARQGEVVSGSGGAKRFVGAAMDITPRKAIEASVRDSEAKWRELFEQMQEGFFVGRAVRDAAGHMHDFIFEELNPAFTKQTGIPAEDAIGHQLGHIVPDVPRDLIDGYARVVDTGVAEMLEAHVPSLDRWFEARARALGGDRFAVLFLEVSERKRAERLVAESEARFRSLAQSMPNHVWTSPPDGALDWFNDRVYAYSGSAQGSLNGDGWAAMVHPNDIPAAAEAWSNARAMEQPYEVEFRLRRHDGVYRWHIARAVPIKASDGKIDRWIGTNTDIDDQKAAETALAEFALTLEHRVEAGTAELVKAQDALRQAQKMETIGNLTGGVAHDFNNLLQVIGGNLQLLAKDIAGNHRAETRVENAMEGVSRGSKLASQLLAFGRRQPLAPKVVSPARLIRNMDEMLRRALGESIEIETVIAGGLWNTLIDSANLENALLNLAINARDAMDGQGKLTIEAGNAFLDDGYARSHVDVSAGQYVMLAVTDTGSGMSAEVLEKAFDPFFSTKPEGKGTGLGLSMVYGFVKQSGGHIKIYSELGQGTTIKLYLPRSSQSEDVLVNIDMGPIVGGTETILVAEDDNAVRETVMATLSDLGYRVLQAPDAQSALAIIESGMAIDLLFTDVVMPGNLKSTELARKAVERLPQLGVLFTSGYTENSIVHAGRLDPGVELLSKPYTREALARKLRAVFANTKQRMLTATTTQQSIPSVPGDPPVRSLVVLICEDDALIRMSTRDMLEELGHSVLEAGDAREALGIINSNQIDLLMTDVGLPDMSGVALVERVRTIAPDLPVLFATGHDRVEGTAMGPMTRLVRKPFGSDDLSKAILAVVGGVSEG